MTFVKNLQPYLDIGTAESENVQIDFYAHIDKMVANVRVDGMPAAEMIIAPKGKMKLNFEKAVDIIISAVEKMVETENKKEEKAPQTENKRQEGQATKAVAQSSEKPKIEVAQVKKPSSGIPQRQQKHHKR